MPVSWEYARKVPHVNRLAAWLFELTGGAVADVDNAVIPKSQREATFTIAALHQWEMDANDDRCIESAEEVRMIQVALLCFKLNDLPPRSG